ncbi:MAG: hypothetical protein P8080_11445 [Gammaproteobacteria bacterium]
MKEHIISRKPLVRVTSALGRLAPCERLPLHVFRADGGYSTRQREDHRRVAGHAPAWSGRADAGGDA